MKIVLDISPLKTLSSYRGIGTYTRELIKALRHHHPEHDYTLTSKPDEAEADLIHYPYFDFYFLTLPLFKSLPTVVTIHDVIPLVFKKHYPPGLRGLIKHQIQRYSLNSVQAVITDSYQSKADIIKHLKLPADIIHPIHLAAATHFKPIPKSQIQPVLKKYQLAKPYLLYVGDINYSKNIPGLITTLASLKPTHHLVLISRALKKNIPEATEIKQLIKKHQNSLTVHILTDIPTDPPQELVALYNGAAWYIQPSLYEGFGLPVLEAMQCGTPVISSTGGSLKEVVGDAAITFDPSNHDQFKHALHTALTADEETRQIYRQKGRQHAKQFPWEQTAHQTLKVYQSLAEPNTTPK